MFDENTKHEVTKKFIRLNLHPDKVPQGIRSIISEHKVDLNKAERVYGLVFDVFSSEKAKLHPKNLQKAVYHETRQVFELSSPIKLSPLPPQYQPTTPQPFYTSPGGKKYYKATPHDEYASPPHHDAYASPSHHDAYASPPHHDEQQEYRSQEYASPPKQHYSPSPFLTIASKVTARGEHLQPNMRHTSAKKKTPGTPRKHPSARPRD